MVIVTYIVTIWIIMVDTCSGGSQTLLVAVTVEFDKRTTPLRRLDNTPFTEVRSHLKWRVGGPRAGLPCSVSQLVQLELTLAHSVSLGPRAA